MRKEEKEKVCTCGHPQRMHDYFVDQCRHNHDDDSLLRHYKPCSCIRFGSQK